jgi:hypothetical protein
MSEPGKSKPPRPAQPSAPYNGHDGVERPPLRTPVIDISYTVRSNVS